MFKGVFIPDKTSQGGVSQTNEPGTSERRRKTSERRWTATKTAPRSFLLLWEREQTCTQSTEVCICVSISALSMSVCSCARARACARVYVCLSARLNASLCPWLKGIIGIAGSRGRLLGVLHHGRWGQIEFNVERVDPEKNFKITHAAHICRIMSNSKM